MSRPGLPLIWTDTGILWIVNGNLFSSSSLYVDSASVSSITWIQHLLAGNDDFIVTLSAGFLLSLAGEVSMVSFLERI